MKVTLKVLADIYSKPDKHGKTKLIIKNKEYLKQFDTDSILAEEYVSPRGATNKRWCFVREGENYYRVKHRFEDIKKLIEPVKIKGFL